MKSKWPTRSLEARLLLREFSHRINNEFASAIGVISIAAPRSANFMPLQAMLGLQQDAPRGKLYVDPALPGWLPDVTLTDLRLGRRCFDIRFLRDGDKTRWEVLNGNHDAVARRSYASGNYLPADEVLSAPDLDEELIRLRHPSH
jgi:hypothetical protein